MRKNGCFYYSQIFRPYGNESYGGKSRVPFLQGCNRQHDRIDLIGNETITQDYLDGKRDEQGHDQQTFEKQVLVLL